MTAITAELNAIAGRVARLGLTARTVQSRVLGDAKLLIENESSQVKVEVNVVFRRTVLPIERRALVGRSAEMFSSATRSSRTCDRRAPRQQAGRRDGIASIRAICSMCGAVECFVTYLAGHNRPTHEVLFGNDKDIARYYTDNFIGMTTESVGLDTLLQTRVRLRSELPRWLSDKHRGILTGLARAEPDWSLLQCPHAAALPALRWKLASLQTFRQRRPRDFEKQASILEAQLRKWVHGTVPRWMQEVPGSFVATMRTVIIDEEMGLPMRSRCVAFLAGVLQMKKLIFVGFIVLGVALGLFAAITESIGVQTVMGGVGAVAGAAIGGGLTGIGKRRQHGRHRVDEEATALESAQKERVKTYWLDHGRLTAAPGLPNPDDTDPHRRQR